ncbi:ERAP1-like C-terminal domain-containing protein [Undibacterium arcticum]
MRNFSAWINRHFGPQALKLGWRKREGDSEATNQLRVDLLPLAANLGAEPTLRAQAQQLARQWLVAKSGTGAAPQLGAMLGNILHSAAYNGDQALFEMLVATAAKKPATTATAMRCSARLDPSPIRRCARRRWI